ncbi:YciI family protein [Croceicoccus sp. BE223]|uniref:YciI family protein n=1 Tax=Croceicoccus sp. BE223 TaxID=2817716 RepID=UPI00285A52F0|nr:YciI family protein [Croceicoccus sp. BE223]MDR7101412.1 uncharacterized protein YciI [Croceicoccus sp. BE223]
MFILDITYVAPVERIDELMDEHVAWLKQGHAAGSFVAWGRKVPRTGGIVLAIGGRAEVEAVAAADPFVTSGAVTVNVIEMAPSFVADGLELLGR